MPSSACSISRASAPSSAGPCSRPDGPALIVAGPGSGKTTVLAARIAFLILSRRVPPTSILALTFATKAARDLRTRLHGLLGEPGLSVDVMTFHAFGLRIVRQWSEELGFGIDPPTVYGDGDARSLLLEAADRASPWTTVRSRLGWPTSLAFGSPSTRWSLPSHSGAWRARVGSSCGDDARSTTRRCCRSASAVRGASRRPCASARTPTDTSWSTSSRTSAAPSTSSYDSSPSGTATWSPIGDPRQALYGWRGADVRYLHGLLDDFHGAQLLSLDQNYRSTERIVELANLLAERLGSYSPLWTENPPGVRAVLYVAGDERQEAAYVAAEIAHLASAGAIGSLADVAVLFRTWQAEELIVAFRERRLPYWVTRRWRPVHAKGSARRDCLRLAVNPATSRRSHGW